VKLAEHYRGFSRVRQNLRQAMKKQKFSGKKTSAKESKTI